MRQVYFWLTGTALVVTLLMSFLGGLIVLTVFVMPPLAILLFGIAKVMPVISAFLICGLPAVAMWRRRILAASLGVAGLAVFGYLFAVIPFQSDIKAQAFITQTQSDISDWASPGQMITYIKKRGSGSGCDGACQAMLFDGGVARVQIKAGQDAIGTTYRLGLDAECALIELAPDRCILLTRTTGQAADLIFSHIKGGDQIEAWHASQIGVTRTQLWSLKKPNGDITFARPGGIRPINAGPQFAFLSGGMNQIDDPGFVWGRGNIQLEKETSIEFLRRAGFDTGHTPFTEQGWFANTLTPASRDDALAGDLAPSIKRKLEKFKQRALIPSEVLKGSLDEQLDLMDAIWQGKALIGQDTSKLRKSGYSKMLHSFPDQRSRILKPYINSLRQSDDALNDQLRRLIRRYRDNPDKFETTDLQGARAEYAAYLADLDANPKVRDHWLAEHFRVWGMLFGLPPQDVSKLVERNSVGMAMESRCLITTPGDAAAQAYALEGLARLAKFSDKMRNDSFQTRYVRDALKLAAFAGNLDEAIAYLRTTDVLPADKISNMLRVLQNNPPCNKV